MHHVDRPLRLIIGDLVIRRELTAKQPALGYGTGVAFCRPKETTTSSDTESEVTRRKADVESKKYVVNCNFERRGTHYSRDSFNGDPTGEEDRNKAPCSCLPHTVLVHTSRANNGHDTCEARCMHNEGGPLVSDSSSDEHTDDDDGIGRHHIEAARGRRGVGRIRGRDR